MVYIHVGSMTQAPMLVFRGIGEIKIGPKKKNKPMRHKAKQGKEKIKLNMSYDLAMVSHPSVAKGLVASSVLSLEREKM